MHEITYGGMLYFTIKPSQYYKPIMYFSIVH